MFTSNDVTAGETPTTSDSSEKLEASHKDDYAGIKLCDSTPSSHTHTHRQIILHLTLKYSCLVNE